MLPGVAAGRGGKHQRDGCGLDVARAIATELRNSIIDGSYRYCSRQHCGHIANRMLVERDEEEAVKIIGAHEAGKLDELIAHPRQLILSHDQSCNLTCPSCRTGYIIAKSEEQARLEAVMENTILPLLKHAQYVNVTGSGDPFGSKHFRRLLKRLDKDEYPQLKIDLHTNGQLFDERHGVNSACRILSVTCKSRSTRRMRTPIKSSDAAATSAVF